MHLFDQKYIKTSYCEILLQYKNQFSIVIHFKMNCIPVMQS